MAEGFALELCATEEDNGLDHEYRDRPKTNERLTRPERPETSPPKNPKRHRSTTARQHVTAKAIVLDASALPNRKDRLGPLKATTQFREGKAKTSEKSERSERFERHKDQQGPRDSRRAPPRSLNYIKSIHPVLHRSTTTRRYKDTSRYR